MNINQNETRPGEQKYEKPFQEKINEDIKESGKRFTHAGMSSVAHEVSKIGIAVHSAANKLHEENDYFANWADLAANSIDDASRYLENKNPGEVISTINNFSRRNPYITIGGMFLAGLALSRFVKAGT